MIRSFISLLFLGFIVYSCEDSNILRIKKSNEVEYVYYCQDGQDTLYSDVNVFYMSRLYSKYRLINGRINGVVYDYHKNGLINIKTHFIDGKAHGLNKVYNNKGTLLRKSVYIENKQVLFESFMIDTVFNLKRKLITSIVGEKYFFGGELITNSNDSIIRGVYASLIIPDTISLKDENIFNIKLNFPKVYENTAIVVGEFDKDLNCIDTVAYKQKNELKDEFNFKFTPDKKGYDFLIGYVEVPNRERIFFYNDFFVED